MEVIRGVATNFVWPGTINVGLCSHNTRDVKVWALEMQDEIFHFEISKEKYHEFFFKYSQTSFFEIFHEIFEANIFMKFYNIGYN